jgi:hypothetical protein
VKLFLFLLVFFLTATEITPASDDLAQLRIAATKTEVLGGRLIVSVPDQAKSRAVQHGIMAAPESDTEQTRIVIDAGEQRMVLMVYELFARAGIDLEGPAQKVTSRFAMKVSLQKWALAAPLRAVAYFPTAPTKNDEANFVMGLFVVGSDGSVQNFMWYVNPQGATQFDAALKLAKSMADTIAPGTRTLDTAGGERELSAYSKTKSVFATIPHDYVITAQQGPDFIVHHINKIVAFGGENASMGVYLGDHPSNNRDGFTKQEKTTLFDKSVHWYQKLDNEDGTKVIMVGATVPLGWSLLGNSVPGTSEGASYADVFLTAVNASNIEELKSIAVTLRIGDRTGQR